MRLFAIYSRGPHSSLADRVWYGPENGYYNYTGWPLAVTKLPSFCFWSMLSKGHEVQGGNNHMSRTAFVVRDEQYYERQMRIQEWIHHRNPKVRVAAIFTDEMEARTAFPDAQIRQYKIGF